MILFPNLGLAFLSRSIKLALIGLFCMAIAACSEAPRELTIQGPTMGTFYKVVMVSSDPLLDEKRVNQEVSEILDAVNTSMSTYIPDSELSKINQLSAKETVEVSPLLNDVLTEALRISQLSNGSFDPTLGKAIRLWGFGEDGRVTSRPSPELLAELKRSTGYLNIKFSDGALTKQVDDLEINLSAIAKGYAVDLIAESLDRAGVGHYLIDIGGELRAKGKNLRGNVWRVGVEKPSAIGGVQEIIKLDNQAIATSGDYRNFLTIDGKQYSHTISPMTLEPVFHRLASVSVMHKSSMTADALATAILSMGDKKGVEFAEQNGLSAYFIIRGETADNLTFHSTAGFTINLVD